MVSLTVPSSFFPSVAGTVFCPGDAFRFFSLGAEFGRCVHRITRLHSLRGTRILGAWVESVCSKEGVGYDPPYC